MFKIRYEELHMLMLCCHVINMSASFKSHFTSGESSEKEICWRE